jgi:dihydrofolate reductase / thymidylate synthase
MALAPFNIIVAIDAGNGIAKDGNIPWSSKDDMRFFRETTIGKRKNAVIMGRLTYEAIPEEYRPLEGRKCIIVSRTWRQEAHPEISVYASLTEALAGIGSSINAYDDVFVCGGEQLYAEAIRDFAYLCKKIYVTRLKADYTCDQFFPYDLIKDFKQLSDPVKTRDYTRYTFVPSEIHDENQYLDIMKKITEEGESKPDRTGVGTKSMFGVRMEFDIRDRIPILTTKRIFYEKVINELIFFISGKTDTRILEDQGVKIWKDNTSKEFHESRGLKYEVGDMGPLYGFQWRHWGAEYEGCDADYTGKGIDQLKNLIENIRKDPFSRRHVLSTWNVAQLDEMVLAPCHVLCQFNVSSDRKWLDCQLYQRSGDMFLGVPFNIACYSILTNMIAHITQLKPRKFIHIIGDAHVYNNHGDQVRRQLRRTPRPFAKLSFRDATRIHEIDDFGKDSFIVEDYNSWPVIQAKMAV